MKTYINPDLKVVEIHKSDAIHTSVRSVTSNVFDGEITGSTELSRSAGLRFDEWYEGY